MLNLSGIEGTVGGVLTQHYTNSFTKKPGTLPRGVITRVEEEGNILTIFAGDHEKKIGFDRRFWTHSLEEGKLRLIWKRPEDQRFSDIKEPSVNRYTIYLKSTQ